MSTSLFKRAAATARRMRFLRAWSAALVLVLTLAGSLAEVLSATSGVMSATGGSGSGGGPGSETVLANGGSGAGGDPGNGIVR